MTKPKLDLDHPEIVPADPQTEARPTPGLQEILARQASQRSDALTALIAEARRCDELSRALPEGDAHPQLRQRSHELAHSIASLLAEWHALGGAVTLTPPGPLRPLAPPPTLQLASPPGPGAPAAPPAQTPSLRDRARRLLGVGLPSSAEAKPPADPEPARQRASQTAASKPALGSAQRPIREASAAAQTLAQNWAEDLGALMVNLHAAGNTQEEMEKVLQAANASFTRWVQYPRSVQRALVGNLACRLRYMQDHLGVTGTKLDSGFRSLTRFSKSFQPGWVNGLTRGRGPTAESWAEEARVWWDQLALSARASGAAPPADPQPAGPGPDEALAQARQWLDEWRQAPDVAKPMCLSKALAAFEQAMAAGVPYGDPDLCHLADEIYDHLELPRFRRLRQAIRDLELAEREERGQDEPKPIPPDWGWWSHTVGRRALALGPVDDPGRLSLLEESFGLATLHWESLGDDEDRESHLQRLMSNGADLVLVLGVSADDPLVRSVVHSCQVRGLPWVHVEHGLGVTRLRMAIERFLQPDPEGAAE